MCICIINMYKLYAVAYYIIMCVCLRMCVCVCIRRFLRGRTRVRVEDGWARSACKTPFYSYIKCVYKRNDPVRRRSRGAPGRAHRRWGGLKRDHTFLFSFFFFFNLSFSLSLCSPLNLSLCVHLSLSFTPGLWTMTTLCCGPTLNVYVYV